jgi:O-antigen/teichoic acid export membrane protein
MRVERRESTSRTRGSTRMGSASRIRTGTLALTGSQLLGPVLQMAQLLVLATILSPADFGVWALPIAIYGIAAIVFEVALPAAIISQRRGTEGLRLRWGGPVVILIAALGSAGLVLHVRGALLLLLMTPAVALLAVNCTSRAQLSMRQAFGTIAATEFVAAVISVLTAIAMALSGTGVYSLLISLVVRQAFLTIMQGALVRSASDMPALGGRHFGGPTVRCAPIVSFYLIAYLSTNLDYLYAGTLLPEHDAGVYFVAYNVATVLALRVVAVANRVALPVLTATQDRSHRSAGSFYVLAAAALTGVVTLEWAMFTFVDPDLLGRWNDLRPVLAWLALASLGLAMSTVASTVDIAGQGRWRLSLLALVDVVCALAALTFVQPESALALARTVAVLMVVRGVIWTIACALWARPRSTLSTYCSGVIIWTVAATGLALASLGAYWAALLGVLIATTVSGRYYKRVSIG